jgi:hypothetical protein
MHQDHREAAEKHDMAARAHRTAAQHNEKGDNPTGNWHAGLALEYADRAFELARRATTIPSELRNADVHSL